MHWASFQLHFTRVCLYHVWFQPTYWTSKSIGQVYVCMISANVLNVQVHIHPYIPLLLCVTCSCAPVAHTLSMAPHIPSSTSNRSKSKRSSRLKTRSKSILRPTQHFGIVVLDNLRIKQSKSNQSINQSMYACMHPSIHSSVHLSVHAHSHPFIHPFLINPPVHPSQQSLIVNVSVDVHLDSATSTLYLERTKYARGA